MMMLIVCAITVWGMLWVWMLYRIVRSLRQFRIKKLYTAALEAPSVSVCIPARNEMHAMAACLERVLASDYRKMEVIVYDDSSADDTSLLVRSFAHAGVRFVPGSDLPEGWLGKNHAQEVLAREASGTYVLFMDVDTVIDPTTISRMVSYMMTEDLVMSSVLPERQDTTRFSTIFGHLRYFWQLLLSREAMPATSGAFWMIKRHTFLDTIGGMVSHKDEAMPEAHIAALIGTKAYHCIVSSPLLRVAYEKRWHSQVETSRRLLYPMMGGVWYKAIFGFIGMILLVLPQVVSLVLFVAGWWRLGLVVLFITLLFGGVFMLYARTAWGSRSWLSIIVWPFVSVQELVLAIYSAVGYARQSITWKGRAIRVASVHHKTSRQ